MMEMATWKRGYEQIPDVRTFEKELGESRKHTSPLWKYLAIGAIPILICGICALAAVAGVLSLGLVILHDRCPPAEIPVTRTYEINLNLASHNWTERSATVTQLNNYLSKIAANNSIVYSRNYNPLEVRFSHGSTEVYNSVYHEQSLDTSNLAISALGSSLRVRHYISTSGNGPSMLGRTVVQYVFRSGDTVLATDSAIDPSATQADDGKERLDYLYIFVPEYTSSVSLYEHHVEVRNVAYQYTPGSVSDLNLLFDRLDHVLPHVSTSTQLNITNDYYVWEQSYFNDGIGPTDVLYPQKLETHLRFIYGSQSDAQSGHNPLSGTLMFRMWMGNDGFGRWDRDTIDEGMTLFHTLATSSWGTVLVTSPSPSPSVSPNP